MEEGNPYVVGFGAQCHFNGEKGFSKDIPRAIELFNKAGELGHEMSYYNLGQIYRNGQGGVDVDLKKAKHYYEKSAKLGSVNARYMLGTIEGKARNFERAFRHLTISAKAGHKESLDILKAGFKEGRVRKDEFVAALRAYHTSDTEMASDNRVAAKKCRILTKPPLQPFFFYNVMIFTTISTHFL
jgi:TPR repeat protein